MDMTDLSSLTSADKKGLLKHLLSFVSPHKQTLFNRQIKYRTRYLTLVLEDIFQPHNASAVLRSCDCFGVQEIHIIENRNSYCVNPDVALGSAKWLTLKKYNGLTDNTTTCLNHLRASGYRLIATTPHTGAYTPTSLPLDQPVAILFGTEKDGLSQQAISMADQYLRIPMVGFTESLNISVSAAIVLYELSMRIRSSSVSWKLPEEEQIQILIQWASAVLKKPEPIIRAFIQQENSLPLSVPPKEHPTKTN